MAKCMDTDGPKEFVRQRNQFSRIERDHLLNIMREFAEKLEDKNLSILARKEIWTTIDRKFREGGFNDRTIAQLKKYWQNYKYHNARNKWRKTHFSTLSSEAMLMSSDFHINDIAHYPIDSFDVGDSELVKAPIVITSDVGIPSSSVTVSIAHPEVSKGKLYNKHYNTRSLNNETETDYLKGGSTKESAKKFFLLQQKKLVSAEKFTEICNSEDNEILKDATINKILSFINGHKSSDVVTIEETIDPNFNRVSGACQNVTEKFSMQIGDESSQTNSQDSLQLRNIRASRQLQLLRYLEAEEQRLKMKLAEMTLKEIHLKILHSKAELAFMHGENSDFTLRRLVDK